MVNMEKKVNELQAMRIDWFSLNFEAFNAWLAEAREAWETYNALEAQDDPASTTQDQNALVHEWGTVWEFFTEVGLMKERENEGND